jgi:2-(1,2-epoxy-1,2-dihydrophenyl)acetyl-CoA isomerase
MGPVLADDDGHVRVVTLNRGDKLNALDGPSRLALLSALEAAAGDEEVRVVVLTGAGRAFCTGQDVTAAEELIDAGTTVAETYNPLARILREMPKPVVAAINGPAVGAGLGLALSCDLRYMAQSAYLACSFSRVGLVPDTGTTVALVRQLGHARAFEVATSARKISAAEAADAHLVNEVMADDRLLEEVLAKASVLAQGPVEAFSLTKELMVRAVREDEFSVLEHEAEAQGVAAASADHREAVAAFLAKSQRPVAR